MESFDVPDSTDWLETPLSLLAPLESSLRCQVCKDFFDNPVITSCSHTFCSLCIRRCLSTEGKCPVCRTSDQELKLRRNWAVQEFVETFQNARQSVLDLARKEAAHLKGGRENRGREPSPKKRKVDHMDTTEGAPAVQASPRRTRTRSQRLNDDAPKPTPAFGENIQVIEDSQDEAEGEEYVPADDGMVACPICQRRMKAHAVFSHLDTCQGEKAPTPPSRPTAFSSLQPQLPRAQASPGKAPERIPAINYSLLKDNLLRKKLRELGIPEWGPKPLLQRRHTEWMNLWNANCDSRIPKTKRALLQELDVWERTQGGNATGSSQFVTSNTVMRKDFDAAGWSASHDTDFKRLIANARKKSEAQVRSTIPDAAGQSTRDPTAGSAVPAESPPVESHHNMDPRGSFDPSR
ncbi:E3 ubiquitin-protein ligase rad18 [Penicillium citrinum]|uniref:Postreplication repair E3 ubiquitin-protein ligase RAD18 n=1 Tax=Penicillium citrinum TaxID=5077 RepID=A0A9W9NZ47_PENCI|nr:E3 ubiquitin-protein ligase rad18 [Penicillium citrinum]KAJ5227379.1 E3 ubiquitin-protein ligase rad18 [Penicillium citrinum]